MRIETVHSCGNVLLNHDQVVRLLQFVNNSVITNNFVCAEAVNGRMIVIHCKTAETPSNFRIGGNKVFLFFDDCRKDRHDLSFIINGWR